MKRCYSCFGEYDDNYSVCPHCGQVENNTPKEPIHLSPGTILAERYVLGHAIGSGGFGIVYKAYDLKLETIVAVKEFFVIRLMTRAEGLKNVIISKKAVNEFEYRKERFLAEAKNMAKFGSHRSIPNVFEFFEENNTAYIVMELLKGSALNDYLSTHGGKLDVDFAILIANEVGAALISLHENKIIHRDVAPDNIYICSGKDIKIKLMDLGAAKLEDVSDEVIDIILKPGYSPAEQYDNSKSVGPWIDIYALGATLYVMLTGVKPDESTNRKIKDEVIPPHMLNKNVSENLSNAIMKAMATEKHMRYRTVKEFLDAVNGKKKTTTLSKEKRNRKIKRAVGIIAACAAICASAILGIGIYNSKKATVELKPADISVWFSVAQNSDEASAMESIKADFEYKFPDVNIDLRAIPEDEYEKELLKAKENGNLPTLFESSNISSDILDDAKDLDNVIESDQFKACPLLDDYSKYYENNKQIPLAMEIPMAYIITSGAVDINYQKKFFSNVNDFGITVNVSYDDRYTEMLGQNFSLLGLSDMSEFMNDKANTSPVLLSSTMIMNEVRTGVSSYEKAYVFPKSDRIYCSYTYEWSIGDGRGSEIDAAEMLLSWMLGNIYQNTLMISECSDGQIPLNQTCFEAKTQSKNLLPIKDIYNNFVFERTKKT